MGAAFLEDSDLKNWEKELPSGYREVMVIDAKDNKKLVRGMGIAALLLFALFLWIGIATQWSGMKEQAPSTRLAFGFFVVLMVYIVLHELVHGAAYNFIITTAYAVQHKAKLCVGLFALKMQIADDDVATVYSKCVFFTHFGGQMPACLRFAEVNT